MIKVSVPLFLAFIALMVVSCKTTENIPTKKGNNSEETLAMKDVEVPQYRGSQTREFELLHTMLTIRPDWQKERLEATADLVMTPYFYERDFVVLDAKNFQIKEVGIVQSGEFKDVEYEYNGSELLIDLGQIFDKNDTVSLRISYLTGSYDYPAEDSLSLDAERGVYFVDSEDNLDFAPRQVWTYGWPDENSFWFPTFDQPNIRSTQELKISVDTAFRTLSNGKLVSSIENNDGTRTDHWQMKKTHAPYLFMFAAGDFAVIRDQEGPVDISYYVQPDYGKYAPRIFGETPEMIRHFSDLLGVPFPWAKYDQIALYDFPSNGMESTSATAFSGEVQATGRELLDENFETIISHRLFQQWFGNLVTPESWADIVLSESFGAYGEQLWIEYKYGEEDAAFHSLQSLNTYLQEAARYQEPLVRNYYSMPEDLKDAHTFDKGSRVLHALRLYVGEEAFFTALNRYLKSNAYNTAEVDDLRLSFEEITGEDLEWFFDQWFFTGGHPELQVSHNYQNDTLEISVEQIQDLSLAPIYRLPLYLDLIMEDGIYRYPLIVEEQKHEYLLPVEDKPLAVIFDGDYQIPGVVDHLKTDDELLSQYKQGDSFYSRYESIVKGLSDSTFTHSEELWQLAVKDRSKHIRQLALELLLASSRENILKFQDLAIQASKDSVSQVRAVALQLLYELDLPDSFWFSAVTDSSILVQSVALDYLLANDVKADSLYDKFKNTEYTSLLLPVSTYINMKIGKGHLRWYLTKIKKAKLQDQYYLLESFAVYIRSAPQEEKIEAAEFLIDIALESSNYLVRFAAIQALITLDDVPGVRGKVRKMMRDEADPRLRELYDSFRFSEK